MPNVAVIGMHRSGTSATTRLISLLGLSMCPADGLIGAGPGNEAGYWESSQLTALNEEILGTLGGAWWRPPVLSRQCLGSLLAGQGSRALDCLRRNHPDQPWVWKDPRNCILLPFWRRLLGQDLVAVLALRGLPEVCRSLRARNGFPAEWSLAMCERYLAQALRALDGMPVVVTRYDELVDDPHTWLADTAAALGSLGVQVTLPPAAEVAAFVRPDLRHGRHGDQAGLDLPLTPAQQALTGAVSGLRGAYRSFPPLPVPAESPSTTATLAAAGPHSGPGPGRAPARAGHPPARTGQPRVSIVADTGPAGGLSRRALLTCVATAPGGSEVLLVGAPDTELEAGLRRVCSDVRVRGCDPADRVDAVAELAAQPGAGYVVFTSDLAHPHPGWAQALAEAFADDRVGAAGPRLRAWHRPGWSTPGLRISDAALNGAWLPAGPDSIHDMPLLCRHFMAVRRPVLAGAGGLDSAMTCDSVWDWELCARIWRAGHRIVAVPGATVTVRFADAAPTPVAEFRRNLLRFAALHLDAGPLSRLIAGLDAKSDPDLVLDVLAAETPARRQWLSRSLSVSCEGYSRTFYPPEVTQRTVRVRGKQ